MALSPMLLFAAGGIVLGSYLVVWALLAPRAASLLEQRVSGGGEAPVLPLEVDPDEAALQRPFLDRTLDPILLRLGSAVLRRTPQGRIDQLRKRVIQAGSSQRPEAILAFEVIAAPAGFVLGIAAVRLLHLGSPLDVGAPVLFAVLGYMLPSSSLKQKAKKRAKEIRRSLPGVLDILTISMEAGLSLDAAIMRVAETESGILATEFHKVFNEIRLGRPRMEALAGLAERTALEELTAFVQAVVQAEPLGVGVANVLRIQSEEMRRLRRQRAEQAGHRAPVLMLLPMLGCIFPCVFMMLLGPAIIEVVAGPGH